MTLPTGKKTYRVQLRPGPSDEATSELFDRKKRRPLLLTGIIVDGKKQEILIDEEGKISEIAEVPGNSLDHKADLIIEGNGAIALPGLVNTHTHAAMTLLRGYADDMLLQPWLEEKIWPLEAHMTGDDVYWGTKLACLEMIRTGTTAFNDMYLFTGKVPQAVDEMGLRAQLSYGYIDIGGSDNEEKSRQMTEQLVQSVKQMNNPRIKAAVGPHSVYTVSPEGLQWCADYAKREEIGIHVHLSETEKEITDAVKKYGKRPVNILDDCGCLTSRTIAAHCCWLNETECTLLGKRGTSAAHNPVSNMKLAVNRAMPYHWLKAAGAPVTLGTDGCASNNNLDMFEEMKVAALLQKYSWNKPTQLPAHEALTMATEAGARALGFNGGKLTVGCDADIILIDPYGVQNTPAHNQVSNLVYSLNGSAVNTMIVQGKVLMYDRIVPGEEEILVNAQKAALGLIIRNKKS
jgi:5-methylthioadenosine/S-adenosylhomocysteine deaminase